MLKKLGREIHQSWFVVMMCVGIIAGAVMGMVFRINYFNSPVWLLFAVVLLVIAFLKPKYAFLILAFLAGMIMVFFRVAETLSAGETSEELSGTEHLILNARDFFAARIEAVIPEPESKLGLSYLLGMKTGLPKDLSENLRIVGLTHIVVASGAHLSILVEVARKVFGRLSRFAGLFFSALFILFFMAMVGWTPSIMRAGIMSLLTLTTWYVGRRIEPWRMILMVAAMTLMVNPLFLTNLGWLLSFASFIGIMMLGPGITKFFYGNKKPDFVMSMVITTFAATIMTLPITLYYFGAISLISVAANILILPTLGCAMGLTFLAGVVAGVPVVETVVGFLATKLLDYHIGVIDFFGGMEQFLVTIKPYQTWVYLLYIPVVGMCGFGAVKRITKKP